MNVYFTFGTFDFLEKVKEKYTKENMLLLSSSENTCLLHETPKKSVFQVPKKFIEVVSIGDYTNAEIAVFTYIPVSKEGEPILEYLFKKNQTTMENEQGFVALRALKPKKNETYLVISFWKNAAYQKWINAINTNDTPEDHFLNGIGQLAQYSKKPYHVIYSINK